MLYRKINTAFEEWFKEANKKALFVQGARQVGKTTTIREFCRSHYENFIELNFIKKPTVKKAFAGDLDADTIILNLSAMGYGPFVKGKTVIFLDEIQECSDARTAIKFLVEDGSYDYIESGSLLGINYKNYEDTLDMYPLDFEEFLLACRMPQQVVDTLRRSFDTEKAVPEFIHEQVMERFRQYLVVGGLPEVVSTFISNRDFGATLKVQKNLVAGYRRDITKYAKKDKALVRAVFDAIPSQLAKKDKRFVIADIEKGVGRRKYGEPTQWLIDAGMAYYSYNVNAFSLPFANVENKALFKLFMVDPGMVCYMSLSGRQFEVMNGTIDVTEGALAEEFVAAELSKKGIGLHYYDKKSKHELDFLIATPSGIEIIEVKSGDNYKAHASLDYALENEGWRIAKSIVLCKSNTFVEDEVTYLPLYMAMFL